MFKLVVGDASAIVEAQVVKVTRGGAVLNDVSADVSRGGFEGNRLASGFARFVMGMFGRGGWLWCDGADDGCAVMLLVVGRRVRLCGCWCGRS